MGVWVFFVLFVCAFFINLKLFPYKFFLIKSILPIIQNHRSLVIVAMSPFYFAPNAALTWCSHGVVERTPDSMSEIMVLSDFGKAI